MKRQQRLSVIVWSPLIKRVAVAMSRCAAQTTCQGRTTKRPQDDPQPETGNRRARTGTTLDGAPLRELDAVMTDHSTAIYEAGHAVIARVLTMRVHGCKIVRPPPTTPGFVGLAYVASRLRIKFERQHAHQTRVLADRRRHHARRTLRRVAAARPPPSGRIRSARGVVH